MPAGHHPFQQPLQELWTRSTIHEDRDGVWVSTPKLSTRPPVEAGYLLNATDVGSGKSEVGGKRRADLGWAACSVLAAQERINPLDHPPTHAV